jgi:hypothetical protein
MIDVLYATFVMVYQFYLVLVDAVLYGNPVLDLLILMFYTTAVFFLIEAFSYERRSK